MLPIDFPTRSQLLAMAAERAEACVSIYIETTAVSTGSPNSSRIAFRNAVRDALHQVRQRSLGRGRLELMQDLLNDLADDDIVWSYQARSLAALATPDHLWTFRLANRVVPTVQVSDRFHLKPLLRAASNPRSGFVIALSESSARLIEVFPDLPAVEISVPGMPRDGAANFAGKASINDRSHSSRLVGSEGKKVRLRQYARAVDGALRDILTEGPMPVILASNQPLTSLFRSVASLPTLLPETIGGEIDRRSPAQLADEALPILDSALAARIAAFQELYRNRANQGRSTSDVAVAANAAVRGAIESILIDMDTPLPGTLDEQTGAVTFAENDGPESYGLVDQIALLALSSGAQVFAVRRDDLPENAALAATLRFSL